MKRLSCILCLAMTMVLLAGCARSVGDTLYQSVEPYNAPVWLDELDAPLAVRPILTATTTTSTTAQAAIIATKATLGTTKRATTKTTTTKKKTTTGTTMAAGAPVILPKVGENLDGNLVVESASISGRTVTLSIKNPSSTEETGLGSYLEYTCHSRAGKVLVSGTATFDRIEKGKTRTCTFTVPSNTGRVEITDCLAVYWAD